LLTQQLKRDISSLDERYNDNIKNGGKFSDAKKFAEHKKADRKTQEILAQSEE
jgi:hypothetical protein